MEAIQALSTAVRLSRAFTSSGSFERACSVLLDSARGTLGASRASLLLVDAEGVMRFRAWNGLSDQYRALVEGHTPWPLDAPDPQPIVVSDIGEFDGPEHIRDCIVAEGIAAVAFVPLRGPDKLLGKFMLYYDEPRTLSDEELLLARLLADQASFALSRFRAEDEAERSREELRAVLDNVTDGITVQDPAGRLLYANDAAADLCGVATGEELVRLPPAEVVQRFTLIAESGEPLPPHALPNRWALLGTRAQATVGYKAAGRARIRWSRVVSQPCFAADGSVRFAVTVIEDITTARHEAESRQFLLKSSALLAGSLDVEETLGAVARLAVSHLCDWCGLELLGDETTKPTLTIAHLDPTKAELARRLFTQFPSPPDAIRGRRHVARTGIPELASTITDPMLVAAAQSPEHLALLRELRLTSTLTVPLRSRGVILGTLSFGTGESGRTLSDDDVSVALKLADRAAMALDNARLFTALADQHEQLSVTLASIGDAVIATDRAGVVTMLNGVAEQLTGWSTADAVGKPLTTVFPIFSERTGKPVPNPVEEVLARGNIVGLANHTELEARDGTRRSIADSAAPIRDSAGTIIGVVLVFRDVTHQVRIEQEMAKTSKLQSIGVLAGGIAHDFNNILTSIVASLSLVSRRLAEDHPARARLKAAVAGCDRARDLTRQLLTFARGGAPVKRPTALPDVLREACGFATQGSAVAAAFRVPEDLWPVDSDAGQISQVVHNLVLNAVQAMPAGGRLEVVADNVFLDEHTWLPLPPGRYVRFSVTDAGAGISPDDIGHIFDPFFTTKPQGSGLGLTTTYSIVRRHDGHVGVQSRLGVGTTFTVHLPVSESMDVPPAAPPSAPSPPGRGRVLVMDDDLGILDLAGECLRELGYQPEGVTDGAEAIARYAEAHAADRPYEAVILDLTVPGGMGGCETLRRLREGFPGVRAIVSSGYSNDPVMADFEDHGFAAVIQKPYGVEELAAVLHAVTGG